jgi:hypothetical protein
MFINSAISCKIRAIVLEIHFISVCNIMKVFIDLYISWLKMVVFPYLNDSDLGLCMFLINLEVELKI